MWEGLSNLLQGAGSSIKDWAGSTDWDNMSVLLGRTGAAVSPQDSWQQRLGASAAEMGAQEQSRKYLSELLGGSDEGQGQKQEKTTESKESSSKSKLSEEQYESLAHPGLGDLLTGFFAKDIIGR